jgi:hypothetical protein
MENWGTEYCSILQRKNNNNKKVADMTEKLFEVFRSFSDDRRGTQIYTSVVESKKKTISWEIYFGNSPPNIPINPQKLDEICKDKFRDEVEVFKKVLEHRNNMFTAQTYLEKDIVKYFTNILKYPEVFLHDQQTRISFINMLGVLNINLLENADYNQQTP